MTKLETGLSIALVAFVGMAGYGAYKAHVADIILAQQTQANNAVVKQKEDANKAIASQLTATVSQLEAAKNANDQTPQTIVKYIRDNPTVTPGVTPVVVTQADVANQTPQQAAMPDAPHVGDLIIPVAETKAWFDAQITCQENLAKLNACTATEGNDQTIIATEQKQVSEDKIALKGGTKWQRTFTALKWIGIGAVVGGVGTVVAQHH